MDQLAGLTVIDFSIWRPGPYTTQLLAERGADVIKVEPPGGDPMRGYPELFAELNERKRSITLDLKDDAGRAEALELARDANVLVEGFRPGVITRLGVGYEAVRAVSPAIVYCSISGFGQTGPLADAAGHDLNYLAWAGALAPDGGEPRWPAIAVADLAGGMAAALAICAALVKGGGEYIDISITDVVASWTGRASTASLLVTEHRGAAGYGVFATADGRHLTLGVVTEDGFWRALCEVLSLGAERDLSFADRMARLPELQQKVTDAVARWSRDELVADLLAAGVPVAPVHDRGEMLRRFGGRSSAS